MIKAKSTILTKPIYKTYKCKIYKLGWHGMERKTIIVDNFPSNVLKIDDWYSPIEGELCLTSDNKIDIVKEREYIPPKDPFKGYIAYSFVISQIKTSEFLVKRIIVRKGHKFKFNKKIFVHTPPTDGDGNLVK